MAHQDENDLQVGRIALIGLVSVLVTVALIEFLQVLFYGFQANQLAAPQFNQLPAEMSNYVADQQGKLVSYEVVDQGREVVTIPIDRAMNLVVEELDSNPQAMVTGVPAPPPPAGPADASESAADGEGEPADAAGDSDVPPVADPPPATATQRDAAKPDTDAGESEVPASEADGENGSDSEKAAAETGETSAEPDAAGEPAGGEADAGEADAGEAEDTNDDAS